MDIVFIVDNLTQTIHKQEVYSFVANLQFSPPRYHEQAEKSVSVWADILGIIILLVVSS